MITKQIPMELTKVESEIIGFMVSIASIIRMPKSVGEIFGLLYISKEPLSMDMMMQRLGVSLGTASQGIKTLRGFGAVKSVYIPGERKEHFEAETDFRKLVMRIIKEDWEPRFELNSSRLEHIESLMKGSGVDPLIKEKVKTLKRLNSRVRMIFDPISKIISS